MHKHLAKMEARGQVQLVSTLLTYNKKGIIFEVVYDISRLDKLVILHYNK